MDKLAYMVKLEVESAGVAYWVAFTVASPQRRRCRQAVGALEIGT